MKIHLSGYNGVPRCLAPYDSLRGITALRFALSQATEEDGSSDEDLDDDAMMELDKGLAALFSEQKKKVRVKKDEKSKLQKEKSLVRDFKIKVRRLAASLHAAGSRGEADVVPLPVCRCWTWWRCLSHGRLAARWCSASSSRCSASSTRE